MELKGTSRKERRDLGMMGLSPATIPMLSPENWERIMLTLSPEDFRTAINTTPEWNQLMTPKKNDALFPMILPMLIVHLPRETILTCRRLSEDVKNRTDELLSNDDHFKETLIGGTKMARLISLMESRPFPERNTFVGRSVVTTFSQAFIEEQENRRVGIVRQVLARYGHLVRKFAFTEQPIDYILESYVSLLRLLPNLKSITIYNSQLHDTDYYDLESLNFPKLEKLEELRLDLEAYYKRTPFASFCRYFFNKYGHQLKSLALGDSIIDDFRNYSRSFDSFALNLKRFEIDFSFDSDAMKKLAAVTTWELEELHLSFYYGYGHEHVPDLLAAVNNFANTLVSLVLMWNPREGGYVVINRSEQMKYVLLPKLKILSLRFATLKMDWIWDFLKRSCKQLKTLCLKVDDEGEIKTAEETGLLVMYVRHLFCVLPMLSKIVINSTSEERVIFRNPGSGMHGCRIFCNVVTRLQEELAAKPPAHIRGIK